MCAMICDMAHHANQATPQSKFQFAATYAAFQLLDSLVAKKFKFSFAPIPFMITHAMKDQLRGRRLSDDRIANLTPQKVRAREANECDGTQLLSVGRLGLSCRLYQPKPVSVHAKCLSSQLLFGTWRPCPTSQRGRGCSTRAMR